MYFCQKQDRNTHWERSTGVLNEKQQEADWKRLYRTVLIEGLCLHLANYFVSFLTPGWSLDPKMPVQICANMDSTTQACRCMATLMGRDSLPFLTLRKPSCTFVDREVLLDLRSGHHISSLQQSSVFATSFVLGVSRWGQSFNFTPLDNHQVSSLGPIYILPHFHILSSLGSHQGA